MAKDVIMPALGMAQESGVLVKWLVAEGASVREGDPLMEVETDKAVVEVPATASGTLSAVAYREGAEVKVGTVLAVLLAPGEAAGDTAHARSAPPTATGPAAAATLTLAAPPAVAAPPPRLSAPRESTREIAGPRPGDGRSAASPKAKRLARQHGIALAEVVGTGPGGAVRAVDLDLRAPAVAALPVPVAPAAFPAPPAAAGGNAPSAAVMVGDAAAPVRPAPEAAAPASGAAWCHTRFDAAPLLRFLEKANASAAHAKLRAPWPEKIVPADLLTRALVGVWNRVVGPPAAGVTVTVYSAAGAGRSVVIGAAQARSVLDVSLARERAEPANAGGGERPDAAGPTIAVDDRSAQAFEQSGALLPAGVLLRLTLGPVNGSGPAASGAGREAGLRLDYDSRAVADPEAAAVFSQLGWVLEDPFSLALYG